MRLSSPRGAALITTIIVVFALSGMVLALGTSMRTEAGAAANSLAAAQASSIARGAEQYVLGVLTQDGPDAIDLDESNFSAIRVGDGYFWIVRPDYGDTSAASFGLTDESGKLNLNSATAEQLKLLPGTTDQIADAIVDWRDGDDTPGTNGAESQYYLSLPEPYNAANSPFETVEELLLVRDVTPELLYGTVKTTLGQQTTSASAGLFGDVGTERGWFDLLTAYSKPAAAAAGAQVVNVNDASQRNRLRTALTQTLGNSRGTEVFGILSAGQFIDIFDVYIRAKLTSTELTQLEPRLTFSNTPQNRAKVNINTAPKAVLMCLNNLSEDDADKLIAQRSTSLASDPTSIAWVVQVLDRRAIGLGNLITGTSDQFSADIVAISSNGRAFKRVRIVVDISGDAPQIVYRRDLTSKGFPMDSALMATMRSGQFAAAQGGMGMRVTGGLSR